MQRPSTIAVNLPEVFDASEARRLKRELEKKIAGSQPFVIVDFSRVKKLNVAGLETLLACMQTIARRDGALQIAGISPEAATLLEMTRMYRLFSMFPGFSLDAPAFQVAPEPVSEQVPAQAPAQMPVAA
ncbi:MAG TPA: STAS domain-containing protein [Terriglobales bacterium]|nr:STAS domain-containing protein [Terriglobales bacterium]